MKVCKLCYHPLLFTSLYTSSNVGVGGRGGGGRGNYFFVFYITKLVRILSYAKAECLLVAVERFSSSSFLWLALFSVAQECVGDLYILFSFIRGMGKFTKLEASFHHLSAFRFPTMADVNDAFSLSFLPPKALLQRLEASFLEAQGSLFQTIFGLFFIIKFRTCFRATWFSRRMPDFISLCYFYLSSSSPFQPSFIYEYQGGLLSRL